MLSPDTVVDPSSGSAFSNVSDPWPGSTTSLRISIACILLSTLSLQGQSSSIV